MLCITFDRLTQVGIFRDGSGSGRKVHVQIRVSSSCTPSTVTGLQLTVVATTGGNYVKWVPETAIFAYPPSGKFMVTEADLERWNDGVVILLEYIVVYQV